MTFVKPHRSTGERHVMVDLGVLLDHGRHLIGEKGVDGLRASQLRVLSLVPPPGVTITELATRTGMTKQGIGQFVNLLVASGHLTVLSDPGDKRVRLVRRTAKGDRAIRRLEVVIAELERRWAAAVGVERYGVFRSTLEAIADHC